MSEKRKVVIDCDPGIDDTFALVMCINKLDVKGIVAVGGNTGLEYTQRNARYVTEITKRTDIPVYAGYDMPILNQLVRATAVHGSGGVGDAVIEEPAKQLEKQHGVDFLIDTFMNNDDISLITLGPLTNVAQAILKEPRLKERIPQILCMGGSSTAGNATPAAEFNIYVDPEAAKIVFESGIPIQMVGLNVTRQNRMTAEDSERIRKIGGPVGEFTSKILDFSLQNSEQTCICDACAVAWWIDPAIITKSIKTNVTIETKGEYTRGMTVCDWRDFMEQTPEQEISRNRVTNMHELHPNVDVAMEFDENRFKELLFDCIEGYVR